MKKKVVRGWKENEGAILGRQIKAEAGLVSFLT